MDNFIIMFLRNSLIMSAVVVLMALLSRIFRGKTQPGVRVIFWLIIAVGFIIPVRPAVFTLSQPDFMPYMPYISSLFSPRDNNIESAAPQFAVPVIELPAASANTPETSTIDINQSRESTASAYITNIEEIQQDTFMPGVADNVNLGLIQEHTLGTTLSQRIETVLEELTIHLILLYCWVFGFIISLLFMALNHFRFILKIKKRSILADDSAIFMIIDEILSEIRLKRKLNLLISPLVTTPVTFGLFRPTIILPVETCTDIEMRFMLMHEALHIKRGDLWNKFLFLIVTAIHWFNPAVYFMNHVVDTEIELACGDAVLSFSTKEQYKQYGEIVFRTAKNVRKPVSAFVSTFSGSGKNLKHRISAIINRTNINRWIRTGSTVLLSILIIVSVMVGCKSADDQDTGGGATENRPGIASGGSGNIGDVFDPPEHSYLIEVVALPKLPDDINGLRNIVFIDDVIYFTPYVIDQDSPIDIGGVHINDRGYSMLYRINLDGTGLASLPDFVPSDAPPDAPPDAFLIGPVAIAMQSDDNGHFWIFEFANVVTYKFPEDIDVAQIEPDDIWKFTEWYPDFRNIRKLDNTGNEILSLIITEETAGSTWINPFNFDADGNIYLGYESTVEVLDENGSMQFMLSISGSWTNQFLRMPDGSIFQSGQIGNVFTLREIDTVNKTWGRIITLPPGASMTHSGNDEFPILYTNGGDLFAFNPDTEETTVLMNWLEVGIVPDDVVDITILDDGRLKFIIEKDQGRSFMQDVEVIIVTRVSYEEGTEKTILTLASYYLDPIINSAIIDFNRKSQEFTIQVTDYSVYDTVDDQAAGYTRLTLDLTTGRIPDILAINWMPVGRYAQKGLLEDLYPFLNTDPELNRTDLIEGVLTANEINGSLYTMFPYFSIMTMIGNPLIVGNYPGWNMDEFLSVIDANPQADIPLGPMMTRQAFFVNAIVSNISQYVDWDSVSVDFDNESFIQLLELSASLPLDDDEQDIDEILTEEQRLIAEGRQITKLTAIHNLEDYQMFMTGFGGDLVFKGIPADNRSGHSLASIMSQVAMTTTSENKDGVWEFIRSFLNADWQRENISFYFPINKTVFNELKDEAMKELQRPRLVYWNGSNVEVQALTQAEIDRVLNLFDNLNNVHDWDIGLWNIINEGVFDYFDGHVSAQDTARIIQNRASIFISEQAG